MSVGMRQEIPPLTAQPGNHSQAPGRPSSRGGVRRSERAEERLPTTQPVPCAVERRCRAFSRRGQVLVSLPEEKAESPQNALSGNAPGGSGFTREANGNENEKDGL